MTPSRFDLTGLRALVTGANTGIGRAAAVDLARHGARVVAVGRSAMDGTVAEIEAAGGAAEALRADLSTVAGATAAFGEALRRGPVDVLVNNAGIISRADAVDVTEEDWDAVVQIDLKVVFFLSQAFARARFEAGAGGGIVNVASLLSFQGGIRVPAYAAAKHGVAGLTRALSNEWAPRGITVNAVAPGYVATNNTAALRADPVRSSEILSRIPMGRWAEPADVAGAVTFLAGPAARYVTGITLPVDGGWLGR